MIQYSLNPWRELSGMFQVKFDVFKPSGLVLGLLIAQKNETNPEQCQPFIHNIKQGNTLIHVTIFGTYNIAHSSVQEVIDQLVMEYPNYFEA